MHTVAIRILMVCSVCDFSDGQAINLLSIKNHYSIDF